MRPDRADLFSEGACFLCGAAADVQCEDCPRWLGHDQRIIEAQAWDVRGWDGVDIRCPAHRRITFATRDVERDRYLPPVDGMALRPNERP